MADPNPPNPTQTAAEWRAQGTAKPAEQEGYSLAAPNPNLGSKLSKLEAVRADLGLNPNPPIDEGHKVHEYQALLWSRIRLILREPFAEFMGVFIMVLFGNGSVAQVLLSAGNASAPGGDGYGSYQSISWGIGVMLGIYVAGDSGAFLNPAITFSSCLYRKLPWRRFPIYLVAQFLGGFCGSGVVYINYIAAINNYEGDGRRTVPPSKTATAGIFCTYPQAFLPKANMFFSEFIASTILMFVIFALKDDSNIGAGNLLPLMLFFLIFGLGACFGFETGYALNLARDFGPRLMSYAVGYGHEVWSAGGYYFWIPMVAPFGGCAFGGFLYDLFLYTGESPVNTPWMGLKRVDRNYLSSRTAMTSPPGEV
ncbi:MAG: aquaporin [Lasallia pustulata]|uniref:Aquaporin n=1 Tax=Lasallia pustulata TaxID=136370 RepID=A0A5M8PYC6_9LECA|nr:MAG: aquaporin [Lasallia pustulata]